MFDRKIRFLILSGVLYCVNWPLTLLALPAGEQVTHGEAQFEHKGRHLKVHASDGSIIKYSSFDISRNESVEFIQPKASSRVLNSIQGSQPSHIDGKMHANGHVYLVNPAGIIFGPHAIIEVGRLFAASARLRDEDFLQKRDHFYDLEGKVINLGSLKADEIHLIGKQVDNQGLIEAPNGFVSISTGSHVMIGEREGHCYVTIDKERLPSHGISATDFIGLAINQTGKIVAKEVHIEGGDHSHLHLEGKICANGEQGGHVQILGEVIALRGLEIDASGETLGGTVLVGGDYQGEGSLRTSSITWMDEKAQIDVSARQIGNGGKVVLWSDGTTIFDGKIDARGGLEGGDGGIIETSGKLSLGSLEGRVNALAPKGKAGNWILDPLTITIAGAGAGTLVQAANCADVVTNLTIANTTINAALANVLLCASTTITQNAGIGINIAAPGIGIEYRAGTQTTLLANATVTTNNGPILFSDNGGACNVALNSGMTLNAGTSTTTFTNTGVLVIGQTSPSVVTITNGFNSSAGPSSTSFQGTVNVTNATGNILTGPVINDAVNPTVVTTNGGTITTGTITLNNDLSFSSSNGNMLLGSVSQVGLHTFTVNGGSAGSTLISSLTTDGFIVNNGLNTTVTGATTVSNVTLNNSVGTITFNGAVNVSTSFITAAQPFAVAFNTGGTITPATTFFNTGGVFLGNAGGSNITFTNGVNTNQTGVTTHSFGTVNTTGTAMSYGPFILDGNTTMNTSNGALTFNSTLTGAHNLTVNTGTTAPLFTGAVSIGDVVGNTSLTINTTGANTVFSGTLTTVGGLTSNNNLVFHNNVSIGGVVTIPSLTTSLIPLPTYDIAFLGGGTITAFTNFFNLGTVTFGSPSLPTLTFTNGVTTVSGPSMTFVQGTVNVPTLGDQMTFGPTTFSAGNSTLTTNDGPMTLGNVTLTGNATLQTGGANLVIGNVSGPGSMSTSSGSTGTTTIASFSGNTFTPSNSLSVTVTGTTTAGTVNLTGMNAGQAVVFNGLVNISTALLTSPAAYSVTFNAGGVVTPSTNFFNTGGVNFGNSTTSSITFTNGLNTSFPGVVTSTIGVVQTTAGPMTLGTLILVGNTVLQTHNNNITLNSTINGDFALFISAPGGIVTFNGIVGGVTPLDTLDVAANSIVMTGNMSTQGGGMLYDGAVTLGADIVLTDTGNNGISFLQTIDGAHGLTMNANANVSVGGAIGGTTPLTALTINTGGTTTLSGNASTSGVAGADSGDILITSQGSVICSGTLFAEGGASLGGNGFEGGNVTITSAAGSITVNNINVSGSAGLGFIGGDSGNITLQPASGYTSGGLGNLPQGTLAIYGTLTALGGAGAIGGVSGDVNLSPAGRAIPLSVATIFGNPAGSDLTISAANLTIGNNEAMTVLGNVLFNIEHTATVGDIVALDNLTINAATLQMEGHVPSQILNYQGILYTNRRVHLISRGTTVNASITQVGPGSSVAIQTLGGVSRELFRQLLFFGNIVLNFDGQVPMSGTIDYVWPADTTWDETPLPQEQISWRQILAQRIDRTTQMLPELRAKWLWIEGKTDNQNPVDEALVNYIQMKGHETQVFSLTDFVRYLRNYQGQGMAKQYIAKVRSILREALYEQHVLAHSGFKEKLMQFLLLEKEVAPVRKIGPSAAFYFSEDVIEYTRPRLLSDDQWRQLIGSY